MITRRLLLASGVAATYLLPDDGQAAAPSRLFQPNPPSPTQPSPNRPSPAKPAAPAPLVLLDPGHGGKDPGAIGVSGTYEKHVALAAAQELKRQLTASGRYRVELTRTR